MATACTVGLMSHFCHQMGPQRAEVRPVAPVMAKLDRTAGQQSFREKPAATDTARRYVPPVWSTTASVGHRARGAAIRASLLVHDPAHTPVRAGRRSVCQAATAGRPNTGKTSQAHHRWLLDQPRVPPPEQSRAQRPTQIRPHNGPGGTTSAGTPTFSRLNGPHRARGDG